MAEPVPGMADVVAFLDDRGWVDMEVYSYDRSALVVAAGQDLTYYHEASLVFRDASFFSGLLSWTTADSGGRALRLVPARERAGILPAEARDAPGHLFAVATDGGGTVLVGASGVTLDRDRVYYYRRENLGPGERLAPWLDPAGTE